MAGAFHEKVDVTQNMVYNPFTGGEYIEIYK